jgi:HlyD family secretion protein
MTIEEKSVKYLSAKGAGMLVVAACALSLAACQPKASTVVTVKVAQARKAAIAREVEFSGVLVPNKTVNIFAKIAGIARVVSVDVGSRVKEGDLLVQIDTKELNAQLKVAEAAGSGVADQAVQAKIGINTARLNLEIAQRAYERTKTQLDAQVVTQSALDDAQTRLDLAKAAYENATHQYQTVSGSGLAQADAQANAIRVQISNSTIASPIRGIVTNRSINPGEITSTSSALMTIADTVTLKLQGNVSQEEVIHLSPGDKVKVTIDGLAGSGYAGLISQVGPIGAATGQYFPVVVSIANDGRLLAGMTAKAAFTLTGAEGVVVPLSAVSGSSGQACVYVVTEGKALKRPVALGMRNGTEVQILSGLTAGESTAISNVGLLQDGMEVAQ